MMANRMLLTAALLARLLLAGPIVDLASGPVEGLTVGTVGVWRGIPYAAPPIGDLRWRRPQEPQPWRPAILDATKYRHNCYQAMDMGWPQALSTQSEDCLYLNVYAPVQFPTKPLPVMFWIHGGGFQGGGGNETRLNGTWDVALMKGVVIVTFNYRLNVFGFAASELLRPRDPLQSTGNYGILDQRQAMRWVQANIGAFGGDNSHVFLVGQSAGASSVSKHLVMPASWGLFHVAGMQSGAFYDGLEQKAVADQEGEFSNLLRTANCSSVSCLLSIPAEDLLELALVSATRTMVWVPVVDGIEMTAPSVVLAQQGHLAPVPILVGSVMEDAADGTPVNCQPSLCNEGDFRGWVMASGANGSEAERAVRLYADETERPGGIGHTKWFWAEKHAGADSWATCPARRLVRWTSEFGQRAFLYYWTYIPKGPNGRYPELAHHSVEHPFLFHVLAETPAEAAADGGVYHIETSEINFSAALVQYWLSFAATATPQGDVLWPEYVRGAPNTLVFGDDMQISVASDLRSDKCDFWDDHFVNHALDALTRNAVILV